MSTESAYKVRIDGEGLTFEREISKEIAEKILMLIISGANPTVQVPKSAANPPATQNDETLAAQKHHSDLSIREFLDKHNAKRNPDIITAAGLYLSIYENMPYFTKEDILNAFELAAEPAPKNFPRDLRWAIKVGWIAEKRGDAGTYFVTSSGKTAVSTSFPDDLIKKTKIPLKAKKASSKKKQENEA